MWIITFLEFLIVFNRLIRDKCLRLFIKCKKNNNDFFNLKWIIFIMPENVWKYYSLNIIILKNN